MNIQIFGSRKSFDTKKVERYFKERKIPYQFIDMKEKGMSRGEFASIQKAVGGLDAMLDPACKDKDLLALLQYLSPADREEKALANPQVFKTPVVRNGRQATVGYCPDVWKGWE